MVFTYLRVHNLLLISPLIQLQFFKILSNSPGNYCNELPGVASFQHFSTLESI